MARPKIKDKYTHCNAPPPETETQLITGFLDLTVEAPEERLHQIHSFYDRPALIPIPLFSHFFDANASQLSHLIPFSLAHSLLPLPLHPSLF